MALALRSIHSLTRLAGGPLRQTARHSTVITPSAKAVGKKDLKDLVKQEVPDLTNDQVSRVVDATFKAIVEQVALGKNVTLMGFGSFEKKHRAARKGRNPNTGAELDIPAKDVPGFSAGKTFKEVVASGDVSVLHAKKAAAPKAKKQ